jgi:protein involved in polysaccharide export with SLBB domain
VARSVCSRAKAPHEIDSAHGNLAQIASANAGSSSRDLSDIAGLAWLRSSLDGRVNMTRPVASVTCLILTMFLGCAARRAPTAVGAPIVAAEALPLAPGETIRLVPTYTTNPGSGFEATVDSEGYIHLMLAQRVHVAGLTPSEAAAAIKRLYVPDANPRYDVTVVRVQPKD